MVDAGVDLPADHEAVRSALRRWYRENRRPFPWRDIDDPWQVLVLEVMSQQTQLERATSAWSAFVEEWPSVETLAEADRSDVIAFWSEHRLGYNRRAGYLHEAAEEVLERFDGTVPSDPEELETLPGVGPYTANAVANVAFGTGGPVIDTNVKRVLYRAFDVPDDDAVFDRVARTLHPSVGLSEWTNAIMELGAIACQPTPACDEAACPWRQWCTAYRTGDFTAPDVPTQPSFEGSRRQMRGRVVAVLRDHDEIDLETLGHRIRVDYGTDGANRAWLCDLLDGLAADGLVEVIDRDGEEVARLRD